MTSDYGPPEPYFIRGEQRVRPVSMSNPWVQRLGLNVAEKLDAWHSTLPEPRYEILGPPVGVRFRESPVTAIPILLAVYPGLIPTFDEDWLPGVPLVVVDVGIGPDKCGDVVERVAEYLDCGVSVVWLLVLQRRKP